MDRQRNGQIEEWTDRAIDREMNGQTGVMNRQMNEQLGKWTGT